MARRDDLRHQRVPMRLGDFSVMDSEFGNIRERFDSEMRKMEDEMNRFRSDLMDKESDIFKKSSSHSSHSVSSRSETKKFINGQPVIDEKSSYSSSSESGGGGGAGEGSLLSQSGLGSHSNWLQGCQSPLIKDAGEGQKELKLRFDVSQYSPEEIMVKTVDNKLLVHGKHEEKAEGKSVYREYNREFLLPAGTDPESIRSSLSKDGILTVEAPLPQPAITQQK